MDVKRLEALYGGAAQAQRQLKRIAALRAEFARRFGNDEGVELVSAPGRSEIAGNHTDHNGGCVLAAAVDMDTLAAVRASSGSVVTLYSDMYDAPFVVDIAQLEPVDSEKESSNALIRGVAAGLARAGYKVGGFDAVITSNVQRGSGLSSSAALEVMLAAVFDALFNGWTLPAQQNARISQRAENEFFKKPCGLMDQMASASGGLVFIDFGGAKAQVEAIPYDFSRRGMCACVVSAGGDHGNLTSEYASIPAEMRAVAAALGGKVLRDVEQRIEQCIPELKGRVSDRAILRALHFVDENRRVREMANALKADDLPAFLRGVTASGESSWKLLQNLYVAGSGEQPLALALELSRRMLEGRGAWRVHGGGFAGTILAFMPADMLPEYTARMEAVFGSGSVKPLYIRPEGAVWIK